MKPAGVRSSIYINFFSGNHDKDPKFEVDDQVRIWKFKNVFEKCYISNWSEEVFVINKIKILFRGQNRKP